MVRVNFNEDNPLSFNYHSANVLIKMEMDDREGAHGPDIGLSVSEHMVVKLSDELGALHRGDHVRFNATMQSMGDYSHLHHLHLWGLERLNGHRDVEAHAYSNGRYKVRIEPHDGKDHSHDEPTEHSIAVHAHDDHLEKKKNAAASQIDDDGTSTSESTEAESEPELEGDDVSINT